MHWKDLQDIVKIALNKSLEEIVDITTGQWTCNVCKDKAHFFDREMIWEALKEKHGKTEQSKNSDSQ